LAFGSSDKPIGSAEPATLVYNRNLLVFFLIF